VKGLSLRVQPCVRDGGTADAGGYGSEAVGKLAHVKYANGEPDAVKNGKSGSGRGSLAVVKRRIALLGQIIDVGRFLATPLYVRRCGARM